MSFFLTFAPMEWKRNIMVTGGAGFIGAHLVRLLVNKYPDYRIVNVDALTYCGSTANNADIASATNYIFEHTDITDSAAMSRIFTDYGIDGVIHLAAESHVDRSISDPLQFARTNVMGTLTLLDCARRHWNGCYEGKRFHHVSTDEVFGSLPLTEGIFTEDSPYKPHSPYSASKASSDHFVRAYHDTYGLPAVITNCSNNYGPGQYPEKLIPLFIKNIVEGKKLPVYGAGENVRDWLYVEDHAAALDMVFHHGKDGESYNIGGFNEWRNIDIVHLLIAETDRQLGRPGGTSLPLIEHVTDRPGHDLRYAIDSSKITRELSWQPQVDFREGIRRTVEAELKKLC